MGESPVHEAHTVTLVWESTQPDSLLISDEKPILQERTLVKSQGTCCLLATVLSGTRIFWDAHSGPEMEHHEHWFLVVIPRHTLPATQHTTTQHSVCWTQLLGLADFWGLARIPGLSGRLLHL